MSKLDDLITYSELRKLLQLYLSENDPSKKEKVRKAIGEAAKIASKQLRMPNFDELFRLSKEIPVEILKDIKPFISSCIKSCGQSEYADDLANFLDCKIPASLRKITMQELPNAMEYCAKHGHYYRLSYLMDIESVQNMKDMISQALIRAMRVKLKKKDNYLKYFIEHMPEYYPKEVLNEGKKMLKKMNKTLT